MSVTRIFLGLGSFVRRKPLFFNSIIYGSFYTGAEFAQQTYNRNYNQRQLDEANNRERLMGIQAARTQRNDQFPNNSTKTISTDYDWQALRRYAVYGCFIAGPLLHGWYKWLDKSLRGTAMRTVIVKLLVDQFILTPPLLVLFFVSMSCMEGREDILHELKIKFVKTFQTSCVYWIPVQFLNFLVVPPALRVLYVSVAAFCWVNILCYLKRMPLPGDTNDEQK